MKYRLTAKAAATILVSPLGRALRKLLKVKSGLEPKLSSAFTETVTRWKYTTMIFLFSRVFDRNGDGYISKAEFKHCMMHFGEQFTDDEVEEMIADADSNNDGKIDYAEFSQMILKEIRLEEGNSQRANEDVKAKARASAAAGY